MKKLVFKTGQKVLLRPKTRHSGGQEISEQRARRAIFVAAEETRIVILLQHRCQERVIEVLPEQIITV